MVTCDLTRYTSICPIISIDFIREELCELEFKIYLRVVCLLLNATFLAQLRERIRDLYSSQWKGDSTTFLVSMIKGCLTARFA